MTAHVLCTTILLFAAADEAKAEKYPHAEMLIEGFQLARLPAKKVVVFDARSRAKYDAGHIPGAVWVDVPAWSKAFGKAPDKDEWTKRLGALGVDGQKPVVVYGDDPREPARVWWILRYWGLKDVRLLNGGWPAWATADGAHSREVPALEATAPSLTAHPDRLATKDQVLGYVKDKDHLIIDARSDKEFCGEEKLTNKRGGAIPGSKHLEWSDLLARDGRFKSAGDLARLFKDREISLKEPAVTYCQSGGRAAVMALALELIGAKDVRNYYRSWNEWGNDPATPIVTPKKK